MPQEQRFEKRDTFSVFHRTDKIIRYCKNEEEARRLAMVDIDAAFWIEYPDGTRKLAALMETALDKEQDYKPAFILQELARRANIRAFVVLYRETPDRDIASFRVKRLYPIADREWKIMTPQEFVTLEKWIRHPKNLLPSP